MTIAIKQNNGTQYALVEAEGLLINNTQDALDLIMTVQYETNCDRMVLKKESIAELFFVLSTGMAGDVLQKFVNYRMKLAIIGDFSKYTSKPLQAFMYECNQGNHIYFIDGEQSAAQKLAAAQ